MTFSESTTAAPVDTEDDASVDPAFIACLETEAELLQQSISDGTPPMAAHAKTLLWLDTLVKIHAVGLDESLKIPDATQAAVWSRDLASLEMAMALIQNVKPLNPQEPAA